MSMRVLYNNIDVFSGANSPAPLISRSLEMVSYGGRTGQIATIVLQNALTGQCLTYAQVIANQQALLSGFSRDFQTLSIISDSGTVLSYPNIEVKNISFDESTYASDVLGYSITLEAKPQLYWSGQYGIISPQHVYNFSEKSDGVVEISRTIGAQGFNTNATNPSNALENARAYVQGKTGWSNQLIPRFISGFNSGSVCLKTISETYDRLNGTYQIQEQYIADSYLSNEGGLLRYSIGIESGIEDGITTVSVNGNIQGCKFDNISGARGRYASFNAFNAANNALQKYANRTDLNQFPVTKSVSEDQKRNILDFGYVYNDDLKPKIYIITDISFEFDNLNDIISASVSCTIKSKDKHNPSRWAEILNVGNQINLYSLAQAAYPAYAAEVASHLIPFPLNNNIVSNSRSEDEYNSVLILQATFDNRPIPPNNLFDYNYQIQITPGLHQYSANPILDGQGLYYLTDLGYKTRSKIQITLDAIGKNNSSAAAIESFLKMEALRLQNEYLPGARKVLESQELILSTASFDKSRSLSASWSCEQPEFTIS